MGQVRQLKVVGPAEIRAEGVGGAAAHDGREKGGDEGDGGYRRAAKAGKAAMLDELVAFTPPDPARRWAYFRAWNSETERHAG
jgi:hypothetical protein